jgi:hypothetical protein
LPAWNVQEQWAELWSETQGVPGILGFALALQICKNPLRAAFLWKLQAKIVEGTG